MNVKFRAILDTKESQSSVYKIVSFEENHNHPLHTTVSDLYICNKEKRVEKIYLLTIYFSIIHLRFYFIYGNLT